MVLVIIKALDVLEYVARDQTRPSTLTEIAEGLQLNPATCANILQTLVSKNYLEHVGRKKGYRLGPMAFSLTNNANYEQQLVSASKEVMEALTLELNETSILGVIRNNKRFILHLVNSDQDLQVRSRTERNVYETASGRLLVAFMPPRELESLVNQIGLPAPDVWEEATTAEGMASSLASIRHDELAVTISKTHIIGLAVPIRRGDLVIASLSVFLPQVRCNARRRKEIEQALHRAGRAISQQLN